jgi:hypothetical protein
LPATFGAACGQVDVNVRGLQVAGDDVLVRASHDRCEDRAQQQVAGAHWEVVVAAALAGAQRRELVSGAERDDRQPGMDSWVLACPQRSQQRGPVRGVLELAE